MPATQMNQQANTVKSPPGTSDVGAWAIVLANFKNADEYDHMTFLSAVIIQTQSKCTLRMPSVEKQVQRKTRKQIETTPHHARHSNSRDDNDRETRQNRKIDNKRSPILPVTNVRHLSRSLTADQQRHEPMVFARELCNICRFHCVYIYIYKSSNE